VIIDTDWLQGLAGCGFLAKRTILFSATVMTRARNKSPRYDWLKKLVLRQMT